MEGAEAGLLQSGSLAKKLFSGRVVAGRRGLLGRIDNGLNIARFRHGVSGGERPIVEQRERP